MSQRAAKKILLIGWDAADWTFARPVIARGLMPSLAKLIDTGVSGKLASLQPMLSPMLWNSIATGKRASKHGIHGFTEVGPNGDSIRPVASTSRRCKAVWNILTQSNLRSLVVGWYASHPAEPIDGVCVSNRFEHALDALDKPWPIVERAVHPQSLAAELAPMRVHPGEIQADAVAQFIPKLLTMNDWSSVAKIGKLRGLIAQSASIHAVATHLLTTQPWDFAAVYYEGIDRFGHEFMHCHPPRMAQISEDEFELYREVMTGCYAFHDMMLDALLRAAGEETTVILVSDHGYASDHLRPRDIECAGPTDWHRPLGIAVCAGPGFKRGERLFGASLLDVTPTVLSLFGLPHAEDMDGRPWVEAFDSPIVPDRIASWEAVPGEAGAHPVEQSPPDPNASAEALQQLAALGYIEPLSDDANVQIRQTIDGNDLNLAISLLDARQPEQAEPILTALLARHQQDGATIAVHLVSCLIALGNVDEARRIAAPLAAAQPPIARAYIMMAMIDLAEGKHDAALKRLEMAESIDPELPGLHARIGSVHMQARQFRLALASYEKAVAADPSSATAFDGLAEACIRLNRFHDATDHALEAVGLAHHLPRAHFHLAQALAGLGRASEAIEAASLATRQAPGFLEAHALLAELYETVGDARRATEHRWIASAARRQHRPH